MFDKPNVCPLCKSPALENDKLRFTCGSGYTIDDHTHEHTFHTTQNCVTIRLNNAVELNQKLREENTRLKKEIDRLMDDLLNYDE